MLVERAAGRQGGKAAGEPLRDGRFSDLLDLIPPGDLLVLNSTRVRHARLLGTRPSGGEAEVLLIHPGSGRHLDRDGAPGECHAAGEAHHARGRTCSWKRWRCWTTATASSGSWAPAPEEAIGRYGQLPLPPYITHAPGDVDEERYQTVYARAGGIGRGADGGAALYQCAAGPSRGGRRPDRGSRPRGGAGNVQAGRVGGPERARDARRAVRCAGGAGAGGGGDARCWWAGLGGGNDGGARARERGG